MNKIAIISDSTCDLSADLKEKYNIITTPLHVYFTSEGVDYLDGETLTPHEVYQKVKQYKETPKTGAKNIQELTDLFKKYIDEGYDIIFTGIGSGLSSTYQNACIAAQNFEEGRIEIVDSQNLSCGTGLLVLKMAEFRDQGLDVHEIAQKVRDLVPYVSCKFSINQLDYLHKGGRCSGMTKLLANLFSLYPIAKVYNNELKTYKIIKGKYRKSIDKQIEEFIQDLPHIDKSHVFVTDSDFMDGEDQYVIEKVKEYIPEENIHHTIAGCVISSHCGPKTLGILYIMDKPNYFDK